MFKLKRNKKLMIPVIAIMVLVAMAGNALASIATERAYWTNLPTTERGDTNHRQIYAIQNVMLCYSSITNEYITDHGGVDGSFGAATEDAVEYFQAHEPCGGVDGIVGPLTWGAMYDSLDRWECSDGYTYFYGPASPLVDRIRFDDDTGIWESLNKYYEWKSF